MIMIRQYSREKWEQYWKEKLGIKGYFKIEIQSVHYGSAWKGFFRHRNKPLLGPLQCPIYPFYEELLGAMISACGCKDLPSLSLPRSASLACWIRRTAPPDSSFLGISWGSRRIVRLLPIYIITTDFKECYLIPGLSQASGSLWPIADKIYFS